MARASTIQNQFTRGELSPLVLGRVDIEPYYQGAEVLENCLPMIEGGVTRRPGTAFVAPARAQAGKTRLLPFVFNTEDTYVLALSAGALRFFRARGQVVEDAVAITGAVAGNPVMLTAPGHGYGDGDEIHLAGVTGMSELNGRWFLVDGATTDTFALREPVDGGPVDGSGYGAYLAGGLAHRVYEIAAPWGEDDLFAVQFVQDADTMWLVHPGHKPRTLTRSGHADWTLAPHAPIADPFTAGGDYPAAVAFFEQRLVFGHTENHPQRLFFSRSGAIGDMTTGPDAADGFTKDIFANQANPIRWLVGGTELIAGTSGGEWVVDRPSSSAVTAGNFTIRRRDTAGCTAVMPAEIDDRVVFVQRYGRVGNDGRTLRAFHFDGERAEFAAPSLTLLARHIGGSGFRQIAWQAQGFDGVYQGRALPGVDRVLWAIRADGVLVSMTYDAKELVSAFARHLPGGAEAAVESVATVPADEGDEVWLTIRRRIDGRIHRYVEFLHPGHFTDSAIAGSGPAQAAWAGFHHLRGENVTVLADGSPVGEATVSATGTVSLDSPAASVEIGLPALPRIVLPPLEMNLADGVSTGARLSLARAVLRLHNSVGLEVSASARKGGDPVAFRQVADDVAQPVPPFSGQKVFVPPASWEDPVLTITQSQPLPMTILALVLDMEAHR